MKGDGIFLISLVLIVILHNVESKRMSFDEIKEALQPIKKICIDRVKVDPKLIENANKGNFVPDRKLQCYFKCMMLMTKVMKNDKIVEQALVQIAEIMLLEELLDPVMKAISNCRDTTLKPMEGCELAYEVTKCYYDYDPTLRFYP
ncbi:hypothetical protein P5V15_000398 [Pogonomyrmex californicus]